MPDFKHLFEKSHYNLMKSDEVTELEERLFDEPLFQACSIDLYSRSYESQLTPAEIWYIAECFCIELGRRQKQMEIYFPIMLNRLIKTTRSLVKESFVYSPAYSPHQGDMQTILACIDVMLRCSLGEKQSKPISIIVRESMKPFYYQDAMSMINYGGIEPNVSRILQMPVETGLVSVRENYLVPRPWMLEQKFSTENESDAIATGETIVVKANPTEAPKYTDKRVAETQEDPTKREDEMQEKISKLKAEIARLKQERTDILVELLKPAFFDSEESVRDFLKRIERLPDREITDLVYEWAKGTDRRISDKSWNVAIWRPLYAFKYYTKSKQNWDTALRNHPPLNNNKR